GDLLIVGNATGGRGAPRSPGAIYLLRDANGDGKAETVRKLAEASGSGIALANGYLYSSSGLSIVRYAYRAGQTTLGAPDTIVTDFATGGHSAYNFVIAGGTLYMNVGSRSNACEPGSRAAQTPGVDPCVELETRAGIWAFDANRKGQKPADGTRFATGIRNSVALTVNPADQTLWVTMHGRDGLQPPPAGLWPGHDDRYGAENPGEQVNHVLKGDDFGWPYCYWSMDEKKLVTAPEYGGDGKKADRCAGKKNPVYAFPGHWAPNDMMFYTGSQFPAEYRSGAFVAFHGSWNRAPLAQQGYRVAFLPLQGDRAGTHRDFATGFSKDGMPGTDGRIHRPTGLAQGTDGSLYVSDDVAGTIYKVSYRGNR
ncbi:MAG: PQQ-dependent sugar dehydrogenase, partial [Gemmatimonadota bacterium]|nr:PQQ-dependent sugar dehydrogenase [Gemmatimonadota bacterium]